MTELVTFHGTLESFNVTECQETGGGWVRNVEISIISKSSERQRFRFSNIGDSLRVDFTFFGEIVLEVSDIQKRGWERKSYSVSELTDGKFSFYCETFSVE